ncbi:HIT domain-containing protein [Pyrofollis japonicus]|uniref:HIT family protein n=1 Tax=Pyrofollis japonicus TaxID=3060460 RepID=UPI00295C3666|nr:HIT domain-containing protein [Pyrofollis japonicus]BEP16966.1 HIT domain-containing protein [Pyrofollis japonicus]
MEPNINLLFAPWRFTYIKSISEGKEKTCVFCDAPRKSDEEALILYRGKKSYVIMNLYPYNTGHVMVVPYRHVSSVHELSDDEALEMFKLIKLSIKALKEVLNPHGFNIGINIGRVAGAGIDKHVHIHIVPRWNGDVNFMPVIGGVKVISQDVRETYKMLKPVFIKLAQDVI